MAGRARMQLPPVKYSITRLGGGVTPQGVQFPGGLDLTTPSLALQPGALRAGLNFECSQSGGYGRIQGYERFDGQAKPSEASYRIVQLDTFLNTPAVGQVITQAVSGATGTIIAVGVVSAPALTTEFGVILTDEFGNIIEASPLYYVAVTLVTGTFDTSHAITTPGPVAIGNATPTTVMISAKANAQYLAAAADVYRALIGAVPGSGKIIDVFHAAFGGIDAVYAFRANLGGTAVNLYKSSGAGWVQIPFYSIVSFTGGGTATPLDGATLTQGAVTATVKRVITQTGAWTGTAAGQFVITTPTGGGGHFAAGAATLTGGATVTLSGAESAITLLPGGRGEHVRANFSGQASTKRVYGCDGVNKAYEFDGDVLAPITTGLSPDQPNHITFYKNILVISQASSLLGSAPGLPFVWDAGVGAWEIACGDTLTGFVTVPGSQSTATLAVFMRNNCAFLYGTDPTTFVFNPFNTGLGAIPYSVQNLFDTFFFDDLGIVTTRTTLNYGNFLPTALTKNIEPLIIQERGKITCSTINRTKSQYRVFFSDGYGLYLTMVNQSYLGVAQISFPNPVYVIDNDTDSLGNEVTYFASTDSDGYVYQLDSGTAFDGASLDAYITLAWDAIKSPEILKRFRGASIEMQGNSYAEFAFGYQLSYGSQNVGQPGNVTYPSGFTGAPNWDSGVTWDGGVVWDGQTLAPTRVDMTGTGENVQYTIASTGNYIDAYQINSLVTHYSERRGIRP